MKRVLALVAALAALGAGLAGANLWYGLHTPADREGEAQLFTIPSGASLGRVARDLVAAGLVRERGLFRTRALALYARAQGLDRRIKSGEYELTPKKTPIALLDDIVAGRVKTHPVTIPPGLHAAEIGAVLEARGISRAAEFTAAAFDPELARELDVPADSLEGYLFPETYRFRRDTPARDVARRMVEQFHASWTDEDRAKLEACRWDLHQVVTLASVVEKETGAPEERPRIAAVFDNRLKKRMRLQSDPTVIYGILRTRGSFDGNIRRRDLEEDTPYNTYTRGGFPPGPIASPGMEAIRAVLAPEPVDYLYFVSKNDGTHYFSKRLSEHTAAVDRFQRRRRAPTSRQP